MSTTIAGWVMLIFIHAASDTNVVYSVPFYSEVNCKAAIDIVKEKSGIAEIRAVCVRTDTR